MLDTVDFNHVQHISFTQSRLTDAVSVILSELLSYEHPSNRRGIFSALYHFFSRLSHFTASLVPTVWNSCTSRISRITAANITRYLYR